MRKNIHNNKNRMTIFKVTITGLDTLIGDPSNFIKKKLQHRCFPKNIAKFLRTPTLKNIILHVLYFDNIILHVT